MIILAQKWHIDAVLMTDLSPSTSRPQRLIASVLAGIAGFERKLAYDRMHFGTGAERGRGNLVIDRSRVCARTFPRTLRDDGEQASIVAHHPGILRNCGMPGCQMASSERFAHSDMR